MSKIIIPYYGQILPQEQAEKLPYYQKLVKIRRAFEKHKPHFPSGECIRAARAVKLVTSLKEIAGTYTDMDLRNFQHSWNYDKQRELYIDLTQDQFLNVLPGIVILPSATNVLFPVKSATKHQKRYKTKYLGLDKILQDCVVIN